MMEAFKVARYIGPTISKDQYAIYILVVQLSRLPPIPKKGNAFSESTVTAVGLKSDTFPGLKSQHVYMHLMCACKRAVIRLSDVYM